MQIVDRNSPKPIFQQIEAYILKLIQNGDLKPGDRIPSQYELATACQVSRATVQRAIDRLIVDELLYYQQGKGIYVAAPAVRQHLPILQSVSQSLRVLGHKVYADLLISEQIEVSRYVAEALALEKGAAVIHIKRLLYVNGEPLILQASFLEAHRFQDILKQDLRQRALMEIMQEVEKVHITGSSMIIGADIANWEESRTLNVQGGMPLLTIEEIDYSQDEQPLRFGRNKMRSDRFKAIATTLHDYTITLEYGLQPSPVRITLF